MKKGKAGKKIMLSMLKPNDTGNSIRTERQRRLQSARKIGGKFTKIDVTDGI